MAGNNFNWKPTSTKGYRDGNFQTAKPIEAPRIEYPLQQKGDKTAIILRQKWIQGIEYMAALDPYSECPYKPGAYLVSESPVQDKGQGVGIWEKAWATVPGEHTEREQFPFSYQYISSVAANAIGLGTLVRSVASQIKYEYFLERDQDAFPPLQKLQMDVIGSVAFKSGTGNLTIAAPTLFFVSSDPLIVAEDSEVGTWMYPIMYRATRYVPGPTLKFLGQTTSLPV